MKEFITSYVKGCADCQATKVNTNPTKPALYPISAEKDTLLFQTIAMDFIVKLPTSQGCDTILTITDHDCLKAAIFLSCTEEISAEGVTKLYVTKVFPHFSLPKKVIFDCDPRFTSHFCKELCNVLGISQNISTAFHPQTDSQSE